MRRASAFQLGCVLLVGLGCDRAQTGSDQAALDVGFFECNIQPIFDRSCAFPACHGDPGRPLFLYSKSKTRIAGDALIGEELTDKEVCSNFYRASAFASSDAPSQLLTKPETLTGDASQYHTGNYLFGAEDPEARCLRLWLSGVSQTAFEDLLPPEPCRLPWRIRPDGSAPSCRARSLSCAEVMRGPDLPEGSE